MECLVKIMYKTTNNALGRVRYSLYYGVSADTGSFGMTRTAIK